MGVFFQYCVCVCVCVCYVYIRVYIFTSSVQGMYLLYNNRSSFSLLASSDTWLPHIPCEEEEKGVSLCVTATISNSNSE